MLPCRATYLGTEDIDLPAGTGVTVLAEWHGPDDGTRGVAKIAVADLRDRDNIEGECIFKVSCAALFYEPVRAPRVAPAALLQTATNPELGAPLDLSMTLRS